MKTYLLSSIQNLSSISKNLDAKAILYNKTWEVFNDSGDKEVFIFRAKNELLISRKGCVQKGKWELLSTSSILIDVDEKSFLLNAAFVDSRFMALKLDGTDDCMILIDSQFKKQMILESIVSVENYLETITPKPSEVSISEDTLDKDVQPSNDKDVQPRNSMIALIVVFLIIIILVIIYALSI